MNYRDQQGQPQAREVAGGCPVASLAEKARDGDRTAFEQLVGLFQEEIFQMAYYRTWSRMDAEDLTQEIFMRVYTNFPKLRNPDRFRSWLFSIALNRVWDFLRRKRFFGLFEISTDKGEPDRFETTATHGPVALNRLLRQEFWKQVRLFSGGLSRWEREVFMLRFMEHLGTREIAEILEKSESAVKTHLYRGIKKLKKEPGLLRLLREEIS